MMINKQNVSADSVARFSHGNVGGATPAGADRAMPSSGAAHPAAISKGPTAQRCITTADRTYVAHDLPKSVARDVFGSTVDQEPASGIDWEGIAIGASLIGFLVLAGTVLFKVTDFCAASASQSAWQILRALQQ
jgi:hypothetical protein